MYFSCFNPDDWTLEDKYRRELIMCIIKQEQPFNDNYIIEYDKILKQVLRSHSRYIKKTGGLERIIKRRRIRNENRKVFKD